MNRIVHIAVAASAVAIAVAALWTPWISTVALAALVTGFALVWAKQRRELADLLRDPAAMNVDFLQTVATLRNRLKEREEVVRSRDAEIDQRRQITNAVPDGLFLLDRDDRIVWCNKAALVLHSLDAFRDVGKPVAQLIRQPEFIAYLKEDAAPEPLLQVNGRTLACKLEDALDGSRLLLTRDVTEREQLDLMRRDFVANVSHEMRTPLTVVGGYIETLIDLPLSETDEKRYLELIATQTNNMRRLVEDLLTLARLENSDLPPDHAIVKLASVTRDALTDATSLSAGKHQFEVNIHEANVRGSESELRSAISNLLSNAVRYTPNGGCIRCAVMQQDAQVIVEVKDTGVGISEEHIPRLTERFYRVDRSRSRDTGGTGLGLAIVKHIAQRNHAKLEIESVVGEGSTFRLRFKR
jgi:two-component system, OmpR family, phosphate regulon sensor histidine kinase PhoR